jgi:hypothetical protein
MNEIRKPSFWPRLSFYARAAYLCSSRQARDFSEACAMMAKQPRRKKLPPAPVVMRLPYKDQE